MKLAKRALSLVLALLMVLVLVACTGDGEDPTNTSGKDTNTNTNTSSVGGNVTGGGSDVPDTSGGNEVSGGGNVSGGKDDFVMPDRPVNETNGKTYYIIQHSSDLEPFGYLENSLLAEKAWERIEEVQSTYGCTLKFAQVAYSDTTAADLIQRQFTVDGTAGDLVFSNNNSKLRLTLGTGGNESLMVDLLAVDNIINFWDMEKWGNITSRESMMAGGVFYGVSPALWIDCTPLPYYQMVYNKDVLDTYGVEKSPQEYWEDGKWDRDAMVDVITSIYDDSGASPVWGMTATLTHMIRSTFLTTGDPVVNIEKINADGTAEWSRGLDSADTAEALTWLRNTLKANARYFNNGKQDWTVWKSHEPFVAGQTAMCLTKPEFLFGDIVLNVNNFGLTTWGGADYNTMGGYYENCYSVAIPVFCQDYEHSAFLMADLFEGIDGVEDYDDVVDYYRDTYFETDLDIEFLLRTDCDSLQYSYWPNNVTAYMNPIAAEFYTASSISALLDKHLGLMDTPCQTYVVPNQVALEGFRAAGYFD